MRIVINLTNNLNNLLLILIAVFLLSFTNSKGIAKQKSEHNKSTANCEIKKSKIVCLNFEINDNFKVNLLDLPFRIHINFEKDLVFKNKDLKNHKLFETIRFNKRNKSGSRLELELKSPIIVTNISYEKTNSNATNLHIYISKTSAVKFALAKHILSENNGNILSLGKNIFKSKSNFSTDIKLNSSKKNFLKKKYNVFIDPGHGGRDPGAIGKLGTLEKNITLKASIMLAEALQKKYNINTILSRDKDVYLTLKQRTNLAKLNNADVFISIHADSSKNKKANGISVFSLSDKASDLEAQLLAKRENEVDNFFGNKNKIKDPIIYNTLIKMIQREAMNDSSYLARTILSNLKKTKLAVNRGHRFAGFAVLKSYDIPSVLIEVGFLSNAKEEKKLLDEKYLAELSNSLAIALDSYFDSGKQ